MWRTKLEFAALVLAPVSHPLEVRNPVIELAVLTNLSRTFLG